MADFDLQALEAKLNYSFANADLVRVALTHASHVGQKNYERLEFLGDRVLGLMVSESLYLRFPQEDEGDLAKRLAALVQGSFLARVARDMQLAPFIIFSEAEKTAGGHKNENIIADVVESVLGALYIDGGYDVVYEVILRLWGDNIEILEKAPQDPKTELQEWVQARGLNLPKYEVVGRDGPDHAPEFTVELSIEGYPSITDQGTSRRQTEKTVARRMLKILKKEKT